MNSLKEKIGNNSKSRLKKESASSYVAYLKRVPKILKQDPVLFFKIDSPKKLKTILDDLKGDKRFKKVVPKSQDNILVAFNRYIKYIEEMHNLKLSAKRYLKELNLSYFVFKKGKQRNINLTKLLITRLSRLFETNHKEYNWEKSLLRYLKLENDKDIKLLYKVSMALKLGKFEEMFLNHFETTAKIIAIKTHIKVLKIEND